MRLSPKAISILCLVATTGIGGSLYYALKHSEKAGAVELVNTDGRAKADGLANAPKDYGQIPKLGPPLPGDLGGPILAAQQRGGTGVPLPPVGTSPRASAADAARERAAQERDAAHLSRLFLGGGGPNSAPSPDVALPPLGDGVGGVPAQVSENARTGQPSKRAFLDASNRNTTSLERLSAPVSPWTVQAGSIIPAALMTGIRSDLPGQVTAQVTQNVYDSLTGRVLLIPQGSRLIGEYDAEISPGQNRVLLAWNRLILPDGRSILLDRQPAGDAAGFAGLQDGVNYHFGGTLKAALISTLLGVGAELGSGSDDNLTRAIRRGTQDSVSQTGQQIVGQQLNVQPTLTVRPGHPLRLIVTRDLILEPVRQEARR
jgi:type IV secretion system protein VirB10